MRRVLACCWGTDSSKWVGRRVELYCDESVKYGGVAVGGVRISRMSHIDGPKSIPIIVRQGQGGAYKVDPLPEAPATPTEDPRITALKAEWKTADTDRRSEIEAEVAAIKEGLA